jgi:D-serine dehydratase
VIQRGRSSGATGPTIYQIVVRGELSQRYETAFEGMTLKKRDGQTTITGPVTDQAHLYGLLGRVGDLGLELVSVNPTLDLTSSAVGHARR